MYISFFRTYLVTILKALGLISWRMSMFFLWMNIHRRQTHRGCLYHNLPNIQIKVAENPGTLFKKGTYQMIVLVVLDICLLETFPLVWDNTKWTADKLKIQSCDATHTLVRRCSGRNLDGTPLDGLDIIFVRPFFFTWKFINDQNIDTWGTDSQKLK